MRIQVCLDVKLRHNWNSFLIIGFHFPILGVFDSLLHVVLQLMRIYSVFPNSSLYRTYINLCMHNSHLSWHIRSRIRHIQSREQLNIINGITN